ESEAGPSVKEKSWGSRVRVAPGAAISGRGWVVGTGVWASMRAPNSGNAIRVQWGIAFSSYERLGRSVIRDQRGDRAGCAMRRRMKRGDVPVVREGEVRSLTVAVQRLAAGGAALGAGFGHFLRVEEVGQLLFGEGGFFAGDFADGAVGFGGFFGDGG